MANHYPNIVWIFLDQCRADVLGCYGHPFIETPNIDRLAERGVLFESAFCNNPVCVPSRTSILSGTYSHQNGVYDNTGRMDPRDSHLLRTFAEAGYHTANVGKIHVGLTGSEMGFDEHHEIEHDGIPHYSIPEDYPSEWPRRMFDVPDYPQPVIYATDMCPRERTYSGVGVTGAMRIFQDHDFSASPLFLRLSLDRPHTPVSSPKPFDSMYKERTELPDFGPAEEMDQIDTLRNYRHARRWDQFTPDELLKIRYYYYGLVTHLDAELGRILDMIWASAQRSNSIVVLAADHGCMLGEHGLQVKTPHQYTEVARVPLIMSWPGQLPAGKQVGELVEMVDLLPTLCDLCTLPIPGQSAGRSLLPLINGKEPGRKMVFAEQFAPESAHRWLGVRTQQYAYTYYPNTGEEMLFDLDTDQHERINLMNRRPPEGLVQELRSHIQTRMSA